jgi:hypothetical protein
VPAQLSSGTRAPPIRACFGLFRRSVRDLMRRIGYLPADQPDRDLDAQWPAYRGLFAHLGATCARW